MPRAISVRRKYLPILLSVPSFSWSHSVGGCSLKPFGGGPEGVAYVLLCATSDCEAAAAWSSCVLAVAARVSCFVDSIVAARAAGATMVVCARVLLRGCGRSGRVNWRALGGFDAVEDRD